MMLLLHWTKCSFQTAMSICKYLCRKIQLKTTHWHLSTIFKYPMAKARKVISTVLEAMHYQIATPDEARQILSLKGREGLRF